MRPTMSECGMQWTPAVLHSVTVDRADEALDAWRPLFAGRQKARCRQRPVRDLAQREARFQAGNARQPRELFFVDTLEIGEIARHYGNEVVVLTRHQMAGDDGRRGCDRLLEGFEQILVLTPEANLHDDRHAEAQRPTADARLIALDDALFFESADAPGDGRGGQRNKLGKLDLALAAVLEQRSQNRAIERIEVDFFHFQASMALLAQIFFVSMPIYRAKRQQSFPALWQGYLKRSSHESGGRHA